MVWSKVAVVMMFGDFSIFILHINVVESQVFKEKRVLLTQRKLKYFLFFIFINMIKLIVTDSKLDKFICFYDFLSDFF